MRLICAYNIPNMQFYKNNILSIKTAMLNIYYFEINKTNKKNLIKLLITLFLF